MTREACGTVPGLLAHQAAGERLCGSCSYADQVLRLSAEGIPTRPTPAPETPRNTSGAVTPVSPAEAAEHLRVLDVETRAWEQDHPGFDRASLRIVRGAA